MKMMKLFFACAIAIVSAPHASAQVQTNVPEPVSGAKPVTVEHIKIHGTALEGNLEGDVVDRDVIVFLPPSYEKERARHYPVVYALHGYSIGAEQWTHEIHVLQTPPNMQQQLHGQQIRRILRSTSIFQPKTAFHSRKS